MNYKMYSTDEAGVISNAEAVKVTVIAALVKDGLIDQNEAQDWAEQHCVLVKRDNMFRSIMKKIKQENELQDNTYIVVEVV